MTTKPPVRATIIPDKIDLSAPHEEAKGRDSSAGLHLPISVAPSNAVEETNRQTKHSQKIDTE
eukprot:CAMPEP_0170493770 /NCGR_PEP_ID=MMETSP0208-20121228/14258_1 /TAXON_ID=197538 /ORGANISM="Strombidium inclinatum, Strain S3" /LENGTH=62 /DNA_ID=CAMNT_0010769731 /DNA_START=1088 /DNA_END=1276 /DNA_ORIENTATION=-